MYVPTSFAEDDPDKLHRFIEQNSFGILISQSAGRPFASHLPFLADWTFGSQGKLIGHMARANPQWRELENQEILAIFSGPHAYISPTWYQAEDVVPTWNYLAVHVYGRIALIHDPGALLEIVDDAVGFYESPQPEPWTLEDKRDDKSGFLEKMCKQIVGFHVEITRIEGKWKLGQNHPVERRQRVARALRQQDDEDSQAIAAAVEATLAPTRSEM